MILGGWLVVGSWVVLRKCPQCKKPIFHNPVRFLGVEMHVWTPWVPRRCSRCGYAIVPGTSGADHDANEAAKPKSLPAPRRVPNPRRQVYRSYAWTAALNLIVVPLWLWTQWYPALWILGVGHVALTLYALTRACGRCRSSVVFNPGCGLSKGIRTLTPRIPDRCSGCGTPWEENLPDSSGGQS